MDIVQSLWIGNRLPLLQQLCVRSFLAHGHEYHLYAYGTVEGVPEGTIVRDAGTILPESSIFYYQDGFGKGSCSAFSNLFRYHLIFRHGGWWVDTDLACLRPFQFGDEIVLATEYEKDLSVLSATCAFKCPAGSNVLQYCIRMCDRKDKSALQWGEIGPYLFDDAINRFGLTGYQKPTNAFNPINYFEFERIMSPEFDVSSLADSSAVHLWHQMWQSAGVDPRNELAHDSLLGWLWRMYGDDTD